tara:strand:+ start:64 stop:564 length:501 start_codon:yes stop_codon:yes gene_type:complete
MIEKKYIYLFLFISFRLLAQEYLPKSEGETIRHKYYTLSYNEDHEQANWVHYRLNPTFLNATTPYINSFKVDPSVSTKSADLSDYKGSGYDRGHLDQHGSYSTKVVPSFLWYKTKGLLQMVLGSNSFFNSTSQATAYHIFMGKDLFMVKLYICMGFMFNTYNECNL